MNKTLIYILVAVILFALGFWYWQSKSLAPEQNNLSQDTPAFMERDLDGINIEEANFNSIDADVSSL